jgi:hypothetical protein
VRSELLRFLRYRSQTALSQGRRPGAEASVMKLAYGRYMKALTEAAIAAQGPVGMLGREDAAANGTWMRRFLHAPSLRIAGGSDQVQANIIGERALGLPAEPRPDKGTPFRRAGSTAGTAAASAAQEATPANGGGPSADGDRASSPAGLA